MLSVKAVSLLVLGALVSIAPALAHADLISNGNFASGGTGWTVNNLSNHAWGFGNSGSTFYASTGCVGAPCITGTTSEQATLGQTVTTTSGDSYTLSFSFDT